MIQKRIPFFIAVSIFFYFVFAHNPSEAAKLNGVVCLPKFEAGGNVFELKGLGLKRYFMIKVFAAGFYLG